MQKKILFLGLGKMGNAILENFLSNKVSRENILTVDPQNNLADIKIIENIPHAYEADIVIFAIKPQNSKEALLQFQEMKPFHDDTIFISILAGKELSFFEKILGYDKKLIRLMPNLPILIGEGICAYSCNRNIKNDEEIEIVNLFGKNIKLSDEKLINQVTAISGSGPAYLFLFTKNILNSAVKIGLNQDDAEYLAKQTIFGAAKMLLNCEDSIEKLIKDVTSPKGTTASALEVFENHKDSFDKIIYNAIKAAFERSKDLS